MDKRHEWFREGARTFRLAQRALGKEHFLPPSEDIYACPLCLERLFRVGAIKDGLLTVEHAPPRSLGGKELALTCWHCNTKVGSVLDAAATHEERLREFRDGQTGEAMRVRYTVDDVTNQGELYLAGSTGMMIVGIPEINKPGEQDRFEKRLDKYTGSTRNDLKIDIESYDARYRYIPNRANASWIRAAYVVAFAVFGWRYALQTALNPVRAHLRDPDGAQLPDIVLFEPEAESNRREVIVIEEPSECRCVIVRIGRRSIFLPAIDSVRPLDDLAASLHALAPNDHGTYSLSGKWIPWPTRPQHALDERPADGRSSGTAGSASTRT